MSEDDNATTIEELKQLRSSTKGNISRIKNIVEAKGSTLSPTELECRLGIVESYFKQLLAYQTQIERLSPSEKCRGDLEDLYISTKTKILSLLGSHRRPSVAETTFSVPHSVNHLPKLKLPRFNGKYSEYKNFIHSFTTLVDNDPSLTKIEKFNHLLTCLSDKALGTVKAFQVTEDNYPKAIAVLKERYDNDCLIFLEYISELFDLQKVQRSSANSLRSLVDNISALYNSLQSIGSNEDICNAIIIYIAMSKIDSETQSKWDEHLNYTTLPKWSECATLLSKRCQYLEARESKQLRPEPAQKGLNRPHCSNRSQISLAMTQRCCVFCRDCSHSIASCSSFSALSIKDRFANVKKLGLCLNCLGKGHNVAKCPSTYRCKNCRQPHHSLLHRTQLSESSGRNEEVFSSNGTSRSGEPLTSAAVHAVVENTRVPKTQVILATALVLVQDASGSFQTGRVLLDSGSQVNLVNEKFANSLNLKKERKQVDIAGIGVSETKINFQTQTTIRSRYSDFELSLDLLVAPSITGYQPESALNVRNWNMPRNLELADEHFNQPSSIDLLLGAETFFDLLQIGQIKLGEGLPTLQKTLLGWIVSGRYKTVGETENERCCISVKREEQLERYVEKFWELEEVQGSKSKRTEEQKECDELFKQNTEILPSGRLMVKLPFKKDPDCLGVSYDIAFRRFLSLERRLLKNDSLRSQYRSFLKEYESLGHMTLVKEPNLNQPHYYMPHQCVVRPNSTSTKLRVVFDASCRTSSQISLNGILMVGPTIQDNLFNILTRFRLHRYAITADIVKMYRQILVHPSHRRFQYILWRENETTPVQTFQLNTVTYGTSSAPYLAIRSLHYLSDQNRNSHPLGSHVLKTDFYVDDMLTGGDNFEIVLEIQKEVSQILKAAGLELAKWNSNCPNIVQAISGKNKEIRLSESNLTSTLGIAWNSARDEFSFSYKPTQTYTKYTKRSILSLASSLFDPMGLMSPVIIRAKIILQRLRIQQIDWDTPIPQSIDSEWRQFMDDLHSLQNVTVPRHALTTDTCSYQIHGFADASMQAYGCCFYLRSTDSSGLVQTKLLVAKSRVAPARRRQLPRLELCAAHLLSKLWAKIKNIFGRSPSNMFFWTDSAIVLHWIFTHSSKLGTFVGNRVAEIQEETQGAIWRHVPTLENPADIVSRGCTVEELKCSIWFNGPNYLLQKEESWPLIVELSLSPEDLALEKRKTVLVCRKTEQNFLLEIVERCSSYTKILRTVAYVIRFCRNIKNKSSRINSMLTPAELDNALLHVVSAVQTSCFAAEMESIENNRSLKGCIKWLNPFVQEVNNLRLLRVGGRLKHADIPENGRHPLLLPRTNEFSKTLIRHLHRSNYHAGAKSLVALARQRFWIINARDIARQVVRQCVHCVRYRPKLMEQVMGNLPPERLTSSRPFLVCGVDFCGPINTYLKIRGKVPYKSYVAVFVWFSSKAVHLEAVTDLSAEAFIAALKRMIGRRGLPSNIHCDNATNFVGAQSKLLELRNMAPHFGGIWEAAVKVAKGHLYRSLSGAKLTFEELSTALVEIEAVMNSRPITQMTSDPNDLEALTPGHLLIGSSLKAIPEPATEVPDISYIQRWRRINAVKTHFWHRWSAEYINELQCRSKWFAACPNIELGSLVIIHDDNIPPQKWQMGRIVNVIQGQDGKVRVADVKSARGIIRRPIRKLAPLPV